MSWFKTNGNGANGAHAPDYLDTVEFLLVERLALIEARMAELTELTREPDTYRPERYRALLAEMSALRSEKASSEQELAKERGEVTNDQQRALLQQRREQERRVIDDQIQATLEKKRWWLERLEQENDWRQAMLVRMSLIDLRALIGRNAGFKRTTAQVQQILPGAPQWLR